MKRKNVDDLSLAPEIVTLRADRDKLTGMLYEILRQLASIDGQEDFTFYLDDVLAKVPGAAKWFAAMRKERAAWEKQEAADKAAAIAAVKADIEAAQAKLDKLMGIDRLQVRRKPIVNYPTFEVGDAVWYSRQSGHSVRGKVKRKARMKGLPPHDWGYTITTVGGKTLTDNATADRLRLRNDNGLVDRDA